MINNNIFNLNIDYTLALFRHPFALFDAGGHHSGSPLGFAGSRISVEIIVGDVPILLETCAPSHRCKILWKLEAMPHLTSGMGLLVRTRCLDWRSAPQAGKTSKEVNDETARKNRQKKKAGQNTPAP